MPISRAGTWSNRRGYTLLELAVVIALLGLFAFMVLPAITVMGEDRLGASARRLAGTVKYLYNESALSGLEYRLTFNLDTGTYAAARLEPVGPNFELTPVGREGQLKPGIGFKEIGVAGQGKTTSGEIAVRIFPVGWMEETTVYLDDGKGRVLTLNFSPLTGTVEIDEGYIEDR